MALTKVLGPLLAASAFAAQEVPARASRRISSRHDVNRLERIPGSVEVGSTPRLHGTDGTNGGTLYTGTGTECRKFARWNSAHRR